MDSGGHVQCFGVVAGAPGTVNIVAAPGAGFAWMIVGWAMSNCANVKFQNSGGTDITPGWTPTSALPSSVPIVDEGRGYGVAAANTAIDAVFATSGGTCYIMVRKISA